MSSILSVAFAFTCLVSLVIVQRLIELAMAKKNTQRLLDRGAKEFGKEHYWMLVAVHVLFFAGLIVEFVSRDSSLSRAWPLFLVLFVLAQLGRIWVIRSMRGRWTTRIIVLPNEPLIHSGPFKWIPHPNYLIVAIEIFTLPMIFDLPVTAVALSMLNAAVLLFVRIPAENSALAIGK